MTRNRDAEIRAAAPRTSGSSTPKRQDAKGTPRKGKTPNMHDLVDQPVKVMRIASMILRLLDEARSAPLDDAPGNG
jgi:hypothetical protein